MLCNLKKLALRHNTRRTEQANKDDDYFTFTVISKSLI